MNAAPPPPPPPSLGRSLACATVSVVVGLTQGLGLNLVIANQPAIQGALGAGPVEGAWLLTAYMVASVGLTPLVVKFRMQFGIRLFAELGLGLYVFVCLAHLFSNDLQSAIALRAAAGIAAAPLTSLAFLYMIDAFPAERRPWG